MHSAAWSSDEDNDSDGDGVGEYSEASDAEQKEAVQTGLTKVINPPRVTSG